MGLAGRVQPPIPLALPDAEMSTRLAELSDSDRCTVAIGRNGEPSVSGTTCDPAKIAEKIEAHPGMVFVIAATDDVECTDFFRVLGEVTGAGAQRVPVQLTRD